MSLVGFDEQSDQRTCSVDEQGHRTYQRVFIVRFNDPADGPGQARKAIPVVIRSAYVAGNDVDLAARCDGIDVSEGPLVYRVTCSYTTKVEATETFPWNEPGVPDWDREDGQEIADKEWDGDAIENTANDQFDPPIMREVSFRVLRFSRNELTFDRDLADSYANALNDATWLGKPEGTWRAKAPIGKRATHMVDDVKTKYWQVQYEFYYRKDGWKAKPLNRGFRVVDEDFGDNVELLDKNGQRLTEPKFLNEAGTDVIGPDDDPIVLEFELYEPKDFSVFNITEADVS